MIREYDVIVIGGGPAGSATAINCALAGLSVLLLEKESQNRHKPCGGVLPLVAPETVEDVVGAPIPDEVRIDPTNLGLYYVPPSGRVNSGRVKNYTIHNIDRARFDQWLRDLAVESGAEVKHEARFMKLDTSDGYAVLVETSEGEVRAKSNFLVGADGVRSKVRKLLFPDIQAPVMIVEQEHWNASGDFEDCFYGFFKGDISISYSYLIPKEDSWIIGLGAVPHKEPNVAKLLTKFREWLVQEFSFSERQLIKREAWSIPFGYFVPGQDKALLVGDAAGLCNPLSGEGIRLAVESAEAASSAILQVDEKYSPMERYVRDVRGIADMILELNDFVRNVDDVGRERFVRDELSRGH